MFSKLRTKNDKRNSKHYWKSQKSRDSASERDGSSSESEKHHCRHTQECYRCHKVGHIAWYYPSTAMMESAAPTETAAATMTTSIENYWMTVTGKSPEKDGWYLDCAIITHNCEYRRKFERYMEYTKSEEWKIWDFAGSVGVEAIRHGDVWMRLGLPGGRRNEVVVRNILHVSGAHHTLFQLWLIDWGLQIVPVNGYRIKIHDKERVKSTGRGNLVCVACQIGG